MGIGVKESYKIVISDCHLASGRTFRGRLNPHEEFLYDDEMIGFLEYFSSGKYGDGPEGPVDVELVLNGDYLDFLNVPYLGEFEEGITEEMALSKLEGILKGHAKVMRALREFVAHPGKRITYLVGNHDAELLFPKIRERITREWDPGGAFPSSSVKVVGEIDRLIYSDWNLEIRHGNQFEASNQLDFEKPTLKLSNGARVLNIPWGSIYILKIMNRLKWERPSLDRVRPIKFFLFFGLFLDPWFTFRFLGLSLFYFLRTRILSRSNPLFGFRNTLKLIQQESKAFLDLEAEAREVLGQQPNLQTIVFGHTHLPMHRVYEDGRQYLNSGTWTRMVSLDPRFFGERPGKTFVLLRNRDGKVHAELNQWMGHQGPYQGYLT
jgi:UDP-2,3-diacylglucosamine pyrophosphatase LpxH